MTKNECLIKEGGQSKVVKRKTGIYKVFKHKETFNRENQIHKVLIQPLNQMHVYSPFIEAYPSEKVYKRNVTPKNELKMKKYLCDYSSIMNSEKSSELQLKLDFIQMAYSVYCLHYNKIYHGDIKPENFLVDINRKDKFREIKLADFGGALQLKSRNEKIYLPHCYSYEYHPYDLENHHLPYNPFQTDCYALGVVLNKMSSHLQRSLELQNTILLLKSQCFPIEELFQTPWIKYDVTASQLLTLISQKTSQLDNNSQQPPSSQLYPQQIQAGLQYQQHPNNYLIPQYYPTTQNFDFSQQNLMTGYRYSQQTVSSNQFIVVDNDTTSFTFLN